MDPSLHSVLNKMGVPEDDQARLLSHQISNYQSLKAKLSGIRDKSNISAELQKDLAVAIAYFDSLNVADPLSRFDEMEWMVFYAKYPVGCGININVDKNTDNNADNDIEIIEISSDDEEVLGDNDDDQDDDDDDMKRPPIARKKISSDDEEVFCTDDDDQDDDDDDMKLPPVAREKISSDDEVIVADDDGKQNGDNDDDMKRPSVAREKISSDDEVIVADDDGKQNGDNDDDMKRPPVAREKISSDDAVIVADDDGKQIRVGDDGMKRPSVARKKISLDDEDVVFDDDMKRPPVAREKTNIPKPTDVTSTEQQQDSLRQNPNTEETLGMFEMADQGFDVNEDIFSAFDADEEKAGSKANPIENLSEVESQGRRYKKRQCYYTKSAKGSSVVVGIRSFVSESEAYCVRVVHTRETFLGITKTREEACIPNEHFPSEYVQLKRQELICLSKLGKQVVVTDNKDSPPESLPDWIYEPLIGRSRRPFGYTRDRSNMPSNVTRTRRPRKEFRVLEGFTGAGGMHLGFKEEGFQTAMAVEMDDDAVATFKLNNPNTPVYHGDINEFTKKMKDDEEYSKSVVGKTEVIHTSSPCQGFSTANRNVVQSDSDRVNNELSMRFVDWLRLKQPLIGSFENVVGMWRRKTISWLRKILVECLNLGYQVRVMVLCASDFGDPQKRQRLILFVAKNFVMMPNKPVRTHGTIRYCNDNDNAYVEPFVTIGDVFEHLRKPYAKKTYPNMNDCKTTSFKPGESRDVFQLNYNGSAPTMKCASTCLHYAERINSNNNNDDGSNIDIDNDNDDDNFRCINVREYAAIQSFPYDYEFVGKTLTSKYKQAGNAVPVRLAAAIARTIHDSLRYYYQEELLDIDIQQQPAATTEVVAQCQPVLSSSVVDDEEALSATAERPDFGGKISDTTATTTCTPMDLDDDAVEEESDCVVGNQKRRREK